MRAPRNGGVSRSAKPGHSFLQAIALELRRRFGFAERPNRAASYNVAPTQTAPVVRRRADGGGRELALLRWGLAPPWSEGPGSGGSSLINARAETVATRPAFRRAFRERRCLVPADGFYEWRPEMGRKQPYFIRRRDGGPLAFTGLWNAGRPTPAGTRSRASRSS